MRLAPSLHFRRKSIFEAQRVLKNAGPASARFFRLVCEFVCGIFSSRAVKNGPCPKRFRLACSVRQPHGCRTYELKSRLACAGGSFLVFFESLRFGLSMPASGNVVCRRASCRRRRGSLPPEKRKDPSWRLKTWCPQRALLKTVSALAAVLLLAMAKLPAVV